MAPSPLNLKLPLTMLVNPHFSLRAAVTADEYRWVPSPRRSVELWQMPADDTRTVRIDTGDPAVWRLDGTHEDCRRSRTDHEQVSLLGLPPHHLLRPGVHGGAELPVIDGQLAELAT